MSSGIMTKNDADVLGKHDDAHRDSKSSALHTEVLHDSALMNDAVEGENREHQMGVWEAFKTHPKACMWAFIMCFTIVSPFIEEVATSANA